MNLINKTASSLTIKQLPILLYVIGAIFSLPMLFFGFYNTIKQTGADGSIFGIIWGIGVGYIFLEFVATRQEIFIDKEKDVFSYSAKGLFRSKKQTIPLKTLLLVKLENKRPSPNHGRRHQHVYVCNSKERFLVNNPAMLYINHQETAKILSDFLSLPLEIYTEELTSGL